MESVDRRMFLALAAAVPPLMQAQTSTGGMFVCMHEASADKFDFKTAMEGWARAGIKAVEPNLTKVRGVYAEGVAGGGEASPRRPWTEGGFFQ